MDKIYLIIFAIVIVYIIYKCFNSTESSEYSEYENFATDPKSLTDIDALNNLALIAQKLQTVDGLTLPGSMNVSGDLSVAGNVGITKSNAGGLTNYIKNTSSDTKAYTLNGCQNDTGSGLVMFLNSSKRPDDGGVNVGTVRNDAGSLRLQSNSQKGINIDGNGAINIDSGIITNGTTNNGWISGSFGQTTGDRIVVGNLSNIATVGGHNQPMDAWSDLQIEGNNVIIKGTDVTIQGNAIIKGNVHITGNLTVDGNTNMTGTELKLNNWRFNLFPSGQKDYMTLGNFKNYNGGRGFLFAPDGTFYPGNAIPNWGGWAPAFTV